MPNPADPQALNRYSYVRNNALKYVDPSGHRTCGPGANPLDETCDENMDNPGYGDDGADITDQIGWSGIYLGTNFDWPGLAFEGDAIHVAIELDYMRRYPGSIGTDTDVVGRAGWGIAGAGPNGGYGYPDIIHGAMIWEIKGPSGLNEGIAQVRRYVRLSRGRYVHGEGYVGTTLDHPYVPGWQLVTEQGAPGVIQYQVVRPGGAPVPVFDRAFEGARERDRQRGLDVSPASVPVFYGGPSPALQYGGAAMFWVAVGVAAWSAWGKLEPALVH